MRLDELDRTTPAPDSIILRSLGFTLPSFFLKRDPTKNPIFPQNFKSNKKKQNYLLIMLLWQKIIKRLQNKPLFILSQSLYLSLKFNSNRSWLTSRCSNSWCCWWRLKTWNKARASLVENLSHFFNLCRWSFTEIVRSLKFNFLQKKSKIKKKPKYPA